MGFKDPIILLDISQYCRTMLHCFNEQMFMDGFCNSILEGCFGRTRITRDTVSSREIPKRARQTGLPPASPDHI